MNAVATIEPRRSLLVEMSGRYGLEPLAFADTLRATVMPKDTSNEELAAFLIVAREYNLNPITKEIFAFPKRGGGIQPVVSVDGWANLINSHPQCDGVEFKDALDDKGNLVSVTCKIYRKDRSRPTETTEYMVECVRATDTWRQWPRRMLRHKALIQAARYAFGFAGIVDQDEAERIVPEVAALTPPPAPPPSQAARATVLATFANVPAPVDTDKGAAESYQDWLRDSYAELATCASEPAVEDLRDRVLSELNADDTGPWKEACADRATELFAGKKQH